VYLWPYMAYKVPSFFRFWNSERLYAHGSPIGLRGEVTIFLEGYDGINQFRVFDVLAVIELKGCFIWSMSVLVSQDFDMFAAAVLSASFCGMDRVIFRSFTAASLLFSCSICQRQYSLQ